MEGARLAHERRCVCVCVLLLCTIWRSDDGRLMKISFNVLRVVLAYATCIGTHGCFLRCSAFTDELLMG